MTPKPSNHRTKKVKFHHKKQPQNKTPTTKTGYKRKKSKSLCEVCQKNLSKYEVPKAKIFYCSVECFKKISKEMKEKRIKLNLEKRLRVEQGRFRPGNSGQVQDHRTNQYKNYILPKIPEQDLVPEKLLNFLKTTDFSLINTPTHSFIMQVSN